MQEPGSLPPKGMNLDMYTVTVEIVPRFHEIDVNHRDFTPSSRLFARRADRLHVCNAIHAKPTLVSERYIALI
jgi:hypothetical protein